MSSASDVITNRLTAGHLYLQVDTCFAILDRRRFQDRGIKAGNQTGNRMKQVNSMHKLLCRIALVALFLIVGGCTTSPDTSKDTINVGQIEKLPHPNACSNPIDRRKYSYEIGFKNFDPSEQVRFLPKGWSSKNVVYNASELIGEPVKLPALSLAGRIGGDKRGLWVVRIATGERQQLNYLPPNRTCNSEGDIVVQYDNIWVSLHATD